MASPLILAPLLFSAAHPLLADDACPERDTVQGEFVVVTEPNFDPMLVARLNERLAALDGGAAPLIDARRGTIALDFRNVTQRDATALFLQSIERIRKAGVTVRVGAERARWQLPPGESIGKRSLPERELEGLPPAGDWYRTHVRLEAARGKLQREAESRFAESDPPPSLLTAVIDSGIALGNADFADRLWENPKEIAGNGHDDDGNGVVDDAHGAAFVNGTATNDVADRVSHGTLVAGLIAGAPAAGRPGGIATNVALMPIRVLDGDNLGSSGDVARAIDYAVANHADIIHMSLQSRCPSPDVARALDLAEKAGALVVVAAGNAEPGMHLLRTPSYPALYANANLVVVSAHDVHGKRYYQANYGPEIIDLMAPGVYVEGPGLQNETGYASGTSFAAPLVTGALAMLREATPNWTWPERIDQLVRSGTDATDTDLNGTRFATRLLDLERALSAPLTFTRPAAEDTVHPGEPYVVRWQPWSPHSACAAIELRLSTDGGKTFPELLAPQVSLQDARASVTWPDPSMPSGEIGEAVVKARCVGTALSAFSEPMRMR